MKKFLIVLQYIGKNYFGFQKQANEEKTIQQVVENALSTLFDEKIDVVASGRTDAGVSALMQTAHFVSNTMIPAQKIPFAVNERLPKDIKVLDCKEVPDDFHARFDVKKKTYVYQMYVGNHQMPFYDENSYWLKKQPNIKLMKECLKLLEGKHNFKCFMSSGGTSTNFERIIYYIDITQKENQLFVEVCGNGFLYNMVRIIVGTLLEVGYKKKTKEDVLKALQNQDRTMAGFLVPAKGLYLKSVKYAKNF